MPAVMQLKAQKLGVPLQALIVYSDRVYLVAETFRRGGHTHQIIPVYAQNVGIGYLAMTKTMRP